MEYHFDEIVGFWLESSEVFLFKLKANERKQKPIRTLDGEFFKEEFLMSSFASIYAFYSIEVMVSLFRHSELKNQQTKTKKKKALAIMKIIQEATKELFVQKLLCLASRTHVLQTVVIQTVKQIYSKGERPDPTSVTRDVTSYIRDLLMQRVIADGEMEQILQPIPFFVTSTINRLASEYPNLPDEVVDDKSKSKKGSRQSKRQSAQRDSNIIITPATSPVSASPSPVQTHIATSIASKQPSPPPRPSLVLEPTPSPVASLTKPPVETETVDSPRIAPTPTSTPRVVLTPTVSPRIAPTPTTSPRLAVASATNNPDSVTSIDDVVMKLNGEPVSEGSGKKQRDSTKRHKRKKTKSGGETKSRPQKEECKQSLQNGAKEADKSVGGGDSTEGTNPKPKRSSRKEKRPSSERREHRKRREKKEKPEKTDCKMEEEQLPQANEQAREPEQTLA